MTSETFEERFSKVFFDNHLNQTVASELTGISQPVISNLVNKKTVNKYSDFDKLLKICQNDDQKFYLISGKHLPQESAQHTPTPDEIHQVHTEMLQTIRELTATVRELKEEIRQLREEKKSSQVRHRQKVPEAH